MAAKKAEKKSSVAKAMEDKCCNCKCGKWAVVGWVLLLMGGLAHMLPVQMEPLIHWGMYGVTVQMVVGIASVIMALYFLLGEE